MGQPTIAAMTEEDVPDVLAIENASFRALPPPSSRRNVAASCDPKKPVSEVRLTESQIREELTRPWARLWVARFDVGMQPRPVAFLLAWHVADELHILDVATHPDFRRRGFGTALMHHAIHYGRQQNVVHLLLEVRRSNGSAIKLYRDLGFFAMGVRPRYYRDNEDAIEMVLLFEGATKDIVRRKDEVSV